LQKCKRCFIQRCWKFSFKTNFCKMHGKQF